MAKGEANQKFQLLRRIPNKHHKDNVIKTRSDLQIILKETINNLEASNSLNLQKSDHILSHSCRGLIQCKLQTSSSYILVNLLR